MNSRYDRILILTAGKPSVSISYLASALCISQQETLQTLQQMLREGLFPPTAYINYLTQSIVLDNDLSQNVSQAARAVHAGVNQAVDEITEAFRSIQKQAWSAAQSGSRVRSTQPRGGVRYGQVAGAPRRTEQKSGKKAADANGLQIKPASRPLSGFLYTLAGVLGAIGLAVAASQPLLQSFAAQFFTLLFLGGGAAIAIGRALYSRRQLRLQQYAPLLVGRETVPVAHLAAVTGIPLKQVNKDLSYMISKGLLGEHALVDMSTKTLCLNGKLPEPEPAKPADAAAPGNQYYAIIQEIRTLNDEILDEGVSARIDQIEQITARIFRLVEEKPEKQPQIKSFMSYYLPTTLKLLRSYRTFEKQGIAGENIDSARQDIERILDTLVKGFTQQLDQLFRDEALDISTDIEVLNGMLAKDGLVEDAGGFAVLHMPDAEKEAQ